MSTADGPRCEAVEIDLPTYNVTRFACRCGRFLREADIRSTDHRDDSRHYGIRTEVEWDCSRCGTVKGEEWEPSIVVVGTYALAAISDPQRGDTVRWSEVRNGRRRTHQGRVHAAHADRWLVNLGAGRYYDLTRPVWAATGELVETARPQLVLVTA